MPYAATAQEIEEFSEFKLAFDKVNVQRGSDRFRKGYHEVCLEAYNSSSLDDLADSLEENGYKLVDIEEGGFTYYSKDGKTEVYLDRVWNTEDQVSRVMMLRGKLSEDDLPVTEQQLRALYNLL